MPVTITSSPLGRPAIWGAVAIGALLASPLLLPCCPGPLTLATLVILLVVACGGFFLSLARGYRRTRNGVVRYALSALITALLFVALLSTLNGLIQQHLLFGYKAVNDLLSPQLINGDHYFADKYLFRHAPLVRGEIYVVRNGRGTIKAARLRALPGDTNPFQDGGTARLGTAEYAFEVADESVGEELIARKNILARAVVVYNSYNPLLEKIDWNRFGRPVNQ